MTRPKKEISLTHPRIITFRLSQVLYDVLKEDAKQAHIPISEYIRILLTGKQPVTHLELTYNNPKILQIFRDLGGLSANLNQISRHLNQGGQMTEEMQKEISDCISQIRHMRKELKTKVGEYRGDSKTH